MSDKPENDAMLTPRPPQVANLPLPAVRLGQRLAQMANAERNVVAQVIIINGEWLLYRDGKGEALGNDAPGQDAPGGYEVK